MIRLLKIEWLKLLYYKTFWILSVLYIGSIYGLNFIVYKNMQNIYTKQQTKGMANVIMGKMPYAFPTTWQMTSFVSSFLLVMPALFIIISITNEYSFKTHRQNVIDGISRTQFISVKFLLVIFVAILSSIAVFITAWSFGVQEGSSSFSLSNLHYLGYYFLHAVVYGLVAVLFSILFKRSGITTGVFILYALIFENVMAALLNKYADNIGRYLPIESSDMLIPMPVFRSIQKQFTTEPNYNFLFAATLIYIVLFTVLSKIKFEKSDL